MSMLRKLSGSNLKKAFHYCKKNGISQTLFTAVERLQKNPLDAYVPQELSAKELEQQRAYSWPIEYKFSILVPVYETKPKYLRQMIESVCSQTYANWELILADASDSDVVAEVVHTYTDSRIHYHHLQENAGISRNTNRALEFSTGDYIGLLDHDDTITPNALYEVARCLEDGKKPPLIYSDEDKVNAEQTSYFEANHKENFNLDLILTNNYICHFSLIRAEDMRELRLRPEYDGAQDYDLFLRLTARLLQSGETMIHIPKILYHWRCHEGSTAENPMSKRYAYEAGRKAVQDFVNRQGWLAEVTHTSHLGFYRLEYQTKHAGWQSQLDAGCIFDNRSEIGVVGGPVLSHGRIITGAMDTSGIGIYDGLSTKFSGYMHRATLQQDVEATDIRNMQVRKELQAMYRAALEQLDRVKDKPHKENKDEEPVEKQIRQISLSFCEKVRAQGYLILFDPRLAKNN